jgi:hypothetical protein
MICLHGFSVLSTKKAITLAIKVMAFAFLNFQEDF